jgi:GH25 family lysozyme M1 (1,4-beta-N-acetylmuramidase)
MVADLGVDVSRWQGAVNWSAVKGAGYDFAYIKISDGISSSYATGPAQFHEATNAGLITGVYHYANPAYSAVANADAFASQVNALGAIEGHLPPCLDLEIGVGSLSNWASAFVTELRRLTGVNRVMVYSGVSFFTHQITETWMGPDIFLWLAHYGVPAGQPGYSSPRLALHQYSQSGKVPGIAGNVDLDVALVPLDQLTGDDVTPEQAQQLADIHATLPVIQWLYGQFAGLGPDGQPAPFPEVPGWPTFPGGTDQDLSLLDFGRQGNVQLNALAAAVSELGNKTSTLAKRTSIPPLQLTQADVNRIAAAVVSLQQSKAQ